MNINARMNKRGGRCLKARILLEKTKVSREGGFFYMGSYYALGVGVLRLCLRGRGP